MLSYELDDKLKTQLHHLLVKMTQKYSMVERLNLEEKSAIHRFARISQIGASSRIENAILTDDEIDWMDSLLHDDGKTTAFNQYRKTISNKLSKDRERSIDEVAGCRTMTNLIYDQSTDWRPLTESIIRGLHQELMQFDHKAKKPIGEYKTSSNSVIEHNHETGEKRIIFKTADPGLQTKLAMETLLTWHNQSYFDSPWPIAHCCEFVFRFLAIHPFADGNGRIGRGLFLTLLLQCPNPVISELANFMAIDRQIEKHKSEYYLALMKCSEGFFSDNPEKYKIGFFLRYMVKILEESLADIDYYLGKFKISLSFTDAEKKVLMCFKEQPEKKLAPKEIEAELDLHRRTLNKILLRLTEEKFIQKTGRGPKTSYKLIF